MSLYKYICSLSGHPIFGTQETEDLTVCPLDGSELDTYDPLKHAEFENKIKQVQLDHEQHEKEMAEIMRNKMKHE